MIDRVGLVVSPGLRPATAKAEPLEPDPLKGGDVYKWALEQAALIRNQRYNEIDWINVADEIESVAKSELRSLTSNLVVVLKHMLKWDYQPLKRGRSWCLSIDEHRARIEDDIADSSSMRQKVPDILSRAYRSARAETSNETNLSLNTFPASCPYDWDAIMTRPHVLDETDHIT